MIGDQDWQAEIPAEQRPYGSNDRRTQQHRVDKPVLLQKLHGLSDAVLQAGPRDAVDSTNGRWPEPPGSLLIEKREASRVDLCRHHAVEVNEAIATEVDHLAISKRWLAVVGCSPLELHHRSLHSCHVRYTDRRVRRPGLRAIATYHAARVRRGVDDHASA